MTKYLTSGGWFPNEVFIISAARNTGKSMVANWWDDTRIATISISDEHKGEWVVRLANGFAPTDEIIQWCYDTLGSPGHDRKYRWRTKWVDRDQIFLRNAQDVLLFRLRWM